jgi:hypothetical protein
MKCVKNRFGPPKASPLTLARHGIGLRLRPLGVRGRALFFRLFRVSCGSFRWCDAGPQAGVPNRAQRRLGWSAPALPCVWPGAIRARGSRDPLRLLASRGSRRDLRYSAVARSGGGFGRTRALTGPKQRHRGPHESLKTPLLLSSQSTRQAGTNSSCHSGRWVAVITDDSGSIPSLWLF